jgi:hypothetical protein
LLEAVVKIAQTLQALIGKPLEQLLPKWTFGDTAHVCQIIKQKRQVKQFEFGQTNATKFGQ